MGYAIVCIFIKQGFKYLTCLCTILIEDVTLLHMLSTFTTCERFLSVCYVTNEIKVINVIHASVMFQRLQVNTTLSQQVGNLRFLLCFIPSADKIIKIGVGIVYILTSIVRNAFSAKKSAVSIIYRNDLVDNLYRTAIFANNWLWLRFRLWFTGNRRLFLYLRIGFDLILGIVFVHFKGTIPIRVGKQACNVTEVHECKVGFPVFLTDSCTTTDYLLELGHRVDTLIKHDKFNHLAVHTRREQFACGSDDRVF